MTTKFRLMALHLSLMRSTSADFCLALTANCCVRSRSARTSTWRFSVWWFSSSQRSRITWWEGWGKWPTHYLQNVLTITINHSLDKIVQKSTKVVQSFTLSCTCAGFPSQKALFVQEYANFFRKMRNCLFAWSERSSLRENNENCSCSRTKVTSGVQSSILRCPTFKWGSKLLHKTFNWKVCLRFQCVYADSRGFRRHSNGFGVCSRGAGSPSWLDFLPCGSLPPHDADPWTHAHAADTPFAADVSLWPKWPYAAAAGRSFFAGRLHRSVCVKVIHSFIFW